MKRSGWASIPTDGYPGRFLIHVLVTKRLVDVFLSPIAMIDGVRNKPDFRTPIIAMLFLHIVVGVLHVSLVDHRHYVADFMSAQGGWISQDQVELTRQGLERGGRTMIVIGQASALFNYVFSILVSAGYLALVARIGGGTVSFRHWLSVVAWVSVIGTLSLLARAVAIVAAPDGRLGFLEANPLSLANIVGREFQTMAVAQFDVTSAWRWALLCLAYKRWTSVSWILSILVVLAPVSLLYAISIMIAP